MNPNPQDRSAKNLVTNDSAADNLLSVVARDQTDHDVVSTGRMFFLDIAPHAFIELFYLLRSRCFAREDRPVNVFRRLPASFAHYHGVAFFFPFEHRARANTQFRRTFTGTEICP
jgi:hypothetical protein